MTDDRAIIGDKGAAIEGRTAAETSDAATGAATRAAAEEQKVCVFIADGFEEVEGLTVVDILRRAHIPVQTVSISNSLDVMGSHGIPVKADVLLANVNPDTIRMIVLPGGKKGTDNLEACAPLLDLIRRFDDEKRPISAICAAPRILGHMGILQGRLAASHPIAESELIGATVTLDETALDGHILTSRGMGTAIPFALAIVEQLRGKDAAETLLPQIVFRQ